MMNEDSDQFDEFGHDDDFGESATIDCPQCGETIYEDSEQCPFCQEYILSAQSARHSPWIQIVVWILVALLVLPAILAALNAL